MRVALINYILSRQQQEQFAVRLEDRDKAETIEGRDQETLDLLKKFAIEQEQLFYQSDHVGRHQQFSLSLLERETAFACICTPKTNGEVKLPDHCQGRCLQEQEEIAAKIKAEQLPYFIRIKQPQEAISFVDQIQGEITVKPEEIGDFVILDTEGKPSADFASACDDMLSAISLVIRDEDHLGGTPRQIHIMQSLGYTARTEYAHLPTLLNESSETNTIKGLLAEGFLPDAIINYLLSIGYETPTEIFTLPDAISWFDLDKLSKNSASFDMNVLRQFNRKHLANMEDIVLSKLFGFADADIGKLLKLYLEEADTINMLDQKIKAVFSPKPCEGVLAEQMQTIAAVIQEAPMLEDFDAFKQYITDQTDLKDESLLTPLRLLMVGAPTGLQLSKIYPLTNPYITEIARCTPW